MKGNHFFKRAVDILTDHNTLRMVLTVMVLLRSCAFLAPFVGPCMRFVIVWSVIILLKDLFTKRLLFTNRFRGMLYLFLAAYGVTALINWRDNLLRNIVMLGYMMVNMLVVYAYDVKESPEQTRRDLYRFNLVFLVTAFAGQCVSLVTFFLNLRFTYQIGEKSFFYGIYNGRIWGFFSNPNAASFIAIISLMLIVVSVVLRRQQGKKGWNAFYIVNVAVQVLIVFLCNSRGSMLAASAYLLLLPVVLLLPRLVDPAARKKAAKTAVVFGILLPLAFEGAYQYSMSILPKMVLPSNAINQLIQGEMPGVNSVDQDEELGLGEDGEVELKRQDYGSKYGGRYYLWRAGFKLIQKHPLFGVGSDNVPDFTRKYAEMYYTEEGEEPYLPGVDGGLHNLFIQIAAASGLVGLAIFLAFGILVLIRAVKYLIRSLKEGTYAPLAGLSILMMLVILLRTMTDTGIVYGVYYLGVVFWTYLSQLMRITDQAADPTDKAPLLARISDRVFGGKSGKKKTGGGAGER